MDGFYWELFLTSLGLLKESFESFVGWIPVIASILCLFNRQLSKKVQGWHPISRKWALLPIGLYFAYLVASANYQRFENARTLQTSELNTVRDELRKANQTQGVQSLFIDQLTKENAALAAGGRVLTDAQVRIEAVRQEFLKHIGNAPTKETFTPQLGHEWYVVAQAMEYQTIGNDTTLHGMHFPKEGGTYEGFLETIGAYRSLAMNLTADDLRDNTSRQIQLAPG